MIAIWLPLAQLKVTAKRRPSKTKLGASQGAGEGDEIVLTEMGPGEFTAAFVCARLSPASVHSIAVISQRNRRLCLLRDVELRLSR